MKRALATMVFILFAGPLRAEVVTETIQYHHGERDLLAYVAYDAALHVITSYSIHYTKLYEDC